MHEVAEMHVNQWNKRISANIDSSDEPAQIRRLIREVVEILYIPRYYQGLDR